jgi:NADH-quinone oxidoreductase subunit A
LTNLENYSPILIFIIVGIAVGVLPLVASKGLTMLLGDDNPDAEKLSPYECGFEAFEDARMKFDVRYYLVAILFILFDLEIAFLFPWAIVLQEIGWFGFLAMMVFIGVLVVGFIYEWKKGALDWEYHCRQRSGCKGEMSLVHRFPRRSAIAAQAAVRGSPR